MGSLSNLVELLLGGNKLTGTVPAELGRLSNLGSLWLTFNDLAGPLPPNLTRLTALTLFYFDDTGLCAPRGPRFPDLAAGYKRRARGQLLQLLQLLGAFLLADAMGRGGRVMGSPAGEGSAAGPGRAGCALRGDGRRALG